jgi:hypothetical protein
MQDLLVTFLLKPGIFVQVAQSHSLFFVQLDGNNCAKISIKCKLSSFATVIFGKIRVEIFPKTFSKIQKKDFKTG